MSAEITSLANWRRARERENSWAARNARKEEQHKRERHERLHRLLYGDDFPTGGNAA